MPPPSLLLLPILSLLSLSAAATTTLSLSPTAAPPSLTNPWHRLRHLAAASSARAHHLKHPKTPTATTLPLYPRGYGGYSVTLSFGTPPQPLPFIMDTGSSLVWFPCTQSYSCSSCSFNGVDKISKFLPQLSSTSMLIGCKNPKCKWVFPDFQCPKCLMKTNTTSNNCSQLCPLYFLPYGSGSTTGLLLSESLTFPKKPERPTKNFLVGCSVSSSEQPETEGIAGFGRGPASLPVQTGLKRFSYCLVPHRFDDTPVSSDLILDGGAAPSAAAGIHYTPFRTNSITSNPAFQEYYYVTLRKITVGGVKVKAPYKFLVPDSAGDGGTIVDSGTTFTFVENEVYELIAAEFEKQVGGNYSRARGIEAESGLRPCFDVSGGEEIKLPHLSFHFKGGAEMELPLADNFSFVDESVICMTVVTQNSTAGGVGQGPAITLGNYQQQNFYVEYDLENGRLGFKKQLCK